YGKGYYDRFLAGFEGNMVGLCYSECVRHKLPHGRYDRPVELLVTERFLRRTRPK
ncbi:MAG: 5-formyltetrahydrofolate cyclo-ligase, partial [Clostridiales bacterium]|nr:5-formyltetrahydrofolate cyclo-ligase [Clostridiales bacterium]